jgi:RNA polymerase sigma-70 factor (sigma-E family)
LRIDTDVGGKPAHTVVDGQAAQVVMDSSDADFASASASAAVGFLSAPPGDPVADALTGGTAGGADAIEEPGDVNGTAILSGDAGLDHVPVSGNPGLDHVPVSGNAGLEHVPVSGNGSAEHGSGILRTDGEPADQVERPTDVTETIAARPLLAEAVHAAASRAWDASDVVTEIYTAHYNQLVRLAVMLVHDVQTAEEVVQDSFEAMHLAWRRLRDSEKALSYLRQAIVNRARSVLRHRKVVEMHAPKPAPDEQSAEHAALTLIERSAVTSALRTLPVRQREAVVLRYYGDFSEADIAKAMGISRGAVKSHTARAMAALKTILEQET